MRTMAYFREVFPFAYLKQHIAVFEHSIIAFYKTELSPVKTKVLLIQIIIYRG